MWKTLTLSLIISVNAYSQHFAVIGDFGANSNSELQVSNLVKSWGPEFIITTGDNNYPSGEASTIDVNIGKYYHEFIYPYQGSYGAGATENRFFPSIGNHDIATDTAGPHIAYFTLPGNERYYTFTKGNIDFFVLSSDPAEPDGINQTSTQALWLKDQLAASTAKWKLVYFHHPPYSSSSAHGSTSWMQWPFQEWGATTTLAGHDHTYERIIKDKIVHFVNGLGGKSIYGFSVPIEGSQVRYNGDYGAMRVKANADSITFQFINIQGSIIDTYTIKASANGIDDKEATKISVGPNPFQKQARIKYSAPTSSTVKIEIYNLLGQQVKVLRPETPSQQEILWERDNLSPGAYFYNLVVDDMLEASGKAVIIN